MFIELLDTLRCVRPHEDSWLVGRFDELVDRHVMRGTLGCPVCRAEYPVRGGVVDFRSNEEASAASRPASTGEDLQSASPEAREPDRPPNEDEATRLAALLGLAEPGGVVLLMGYWAALAPTLEELVPGAQFVLVNPTFPVFPFASAVRCDAVLPLATGAARAAAFDRAGASGMTASQAVRVIRSGGRLVAPAGEPLPDGVIELARDEGQWVGERQAEASGPILRLTRRR